ncbi:MAG TPA: hypothetical protein PLS29_02745 [Acidimicrobiales bacterium]|nr:hypothetical protein [Acidimicrobiales bacterium]
MTIALVAVVTIVVVVVLGALVARVRRVRRGDATAPAGPVEGRLVAPPPSPYETSRGFRLLEPGESPHPRPTTARPRLDPERSYVFSDAVSPEEVVPTARRHDEAWFLAHSSRRSGLVRWGVALLGILVVAALVAAVVAYYLHRGATGPSHGLALARAVLLL